MMAFALGVDDLIERAIAPFPQFIWVIASLVAIASVEIADEFIQSSMHSFPLGHRDGDRCLQSSVQSSEL